jgi:predicted ester cyclase
MSGEVKDGEAAAIARRGLEIMDSQEFERLADVMHDDVRWDGGGVVAIGPKAIGDMLRAFYTAFPDLRHEVVATVEEGSAVAVEMRVIGTHQGTFPTPVGEIAGTGNHVDWGAGSFIRVKDGKVVSWRAYIEVIDILAQIQAFEGIERTGEDVVA